MFLHFHVDEHSRVRLSDQSDEGYINANWVPLLHGSLIITQGPLEHTQEHFEQMIVENRLQCMAMLCNIIEGGKVRCFDYTANRKANILSGEDKPITISLVKLEEGDYTHVHYSEWPDRSVPEDVAQVEVLL